MTWVWEKAVSMTAPYHRNARFFLSVMALCLIGFLTEFYMIGPVIVFGTKLMLTMASLNLARSS
jgi:hypothetical protein